MSSERAKQYVTISREAWDFLCGAARLEGQFFGDDHPTREGLYWWRSVIKETSFSYDTELHAIKADMAEIDRIALRHAWGSDTFLNGPTGKVAAIAARYREADPLAQIARDVIEAIWQNGTPSRENVIAAVRAAIKLGIEVGEVS